MVMGVLRDNTGKRPGRWQVMCSRSWRRALQRPTAAAPAEEAIWAAGRPASQYSPQRAEHQFRCGGNDKASLKDFRAYRRFTCVTQLIRQRRSVTGGRRYGALHRSAAGIRR